MLQKHYNYKYTDLFHRAKDSQHPDVENNTKHALHKYRYHLPVENLEVGLDRGVQHLLVVAVQLEGHVHVVEPSSIHSEGHLS